MRWGAFVVVVAACARPGSSVSIDAAGAAPSIDASAPSIDAAPIDSNTVPCDHPEYWPYSIRSSSHPALVHYRTPSELSMAQQVLGLLDHSWDFETTTLGFRPPIDDGGRCGPDGAFDVFLWAGHDECFVDVIGEDSSTAWDDRYAYLVVDPWGTYGGPILDTTVAHEFNHALQAADDWSDATIVYEMTAAYIEAL